MTEAELDSAPPEAMVRVPPAQVAPIYGIGRLARHVLICAGPSCCEADEGARVWGHFKRRLSKLGLTGNSEHGPAVYRTRCDCLRMCADGPIVVVYPEGAWYQNVDAAAADRIISEHVIGGRVVEDLCFALNPLFGGRLLAPEEEAAAKDTAKD
jgi:(2Fe-2S) ferredoxin